MTKPLVLTATMLLMLAANRQAAAQAGPPDRPGVDLALRLGYALPFGKVDGNNGGNLSDAFSGAVPLVIEAGYRFDRRFTLGPYFQYGFAQVKDGAGLFCQNGVSCSGTVVRLGLEALYHVDVGSAFIPWFGLGVGYEWMNFDVTTAGVYGSFSASGWEFLTLQLGGDIYVARQLAVGPFISLSFARYGDESLSGGALRASGTPSNPAVHEWLQFGARVSFGL